MDRDEILAKSRAENRNRDVYEQDVMVRASRVAVLVQMALAGVFLAAQLVTGQEMDWGLWAVVYSANMTVAWARYIRLRSPHGLMIAIAHTLLVAAASVFHIMSLFATTSAL